MIQQFASANRHFYRDGKTVFFFSFCISLFVIHSIRARILIILSTMSTTELEIDIRNSVPGSRAYVARAIYWSRRCRCRRQMEYIQYCWIWKKRGRKTRHYIIMNFYCERHGTPSQLDVEEKRMKIEEKKKQYTPLCVRNRILVCRVCAVPARNNQNSIMYFYFILYRVRKYISSMHICRFSVTHIGTDDVIIQQMIKINTQRTQSEEIGRRGV